MKKTAKSVITVDESFSGCFECSFQKKSHNFLVLEMLQTLEEKMTV